MLQWQVDNIKCGGCAHRIKTELMKHSGVTDVGVDIEQGLVSVTADESLTEALQASLLRMGYPLAGTASGLSAVTADVRSVISCMTGRLTRDVS